MPICCIFYYVKKHFFFYFHITYTCKALFCTAIKRNSIFLLRLNVCLSPEVSKQLFFFSFLFTKFLSLSWFCCYICWYCCYSQLQLVFLCSSLYIIIIIIYSNNLLFKSFSTRVRNGGFHRRLSLFMPPDTFSVFYSILVVLWSELSQFYLWSIVFPTLFARFLDIVPRVQFRISITNIFIFHGFFNPLAWFRYFFFFFKFSLLSQYDLLERQNPLVNKFFYLLLKLDLFFCLGLGDSFVSQNLREFYVSLSKRDSALGIVTWSTTGRRDIRNVPYPSVFELSGRQRMTVKRGIGI